MTVRMRLVVSGLVALLAASAFLSITAWASAEPEVPFWRVSGTRLTPKTTQASIKNVSGVKTTLQSKIGGTEVAARCDNTTLSAALIEGSLATHAGKASGVLKLSACKLFAKEGEAFKEQAGCEIPATESIELTGGLWLEGKKSEGGIVTVVALEPKKLTEGSPLIAKIAINNIVGCSYTGAYALTGSFAMRLLPYDEEFTFIQWVLPEASITNIWRPAGEEGETSVGLKLAGSTASLQGEMKVELPTEETFGGGTAPVPGIEAPFWGAQHKRLEEGEEKNLAQDAISEPTKMVTEVGGISVDIRCGKLLLEEAKLVGSKPQSDGRMATKNLEFFDCKLFIMKEGKFNEQPECEVAPLTTGQLNGKLWLEGTKAERNIKPLLIFRPNEKSVIAEVNIKSTAGEKCAFAGIKIEIEGGLPFRLSPENEEVTALKFGISTSSAQLYQPAEQERKEKVQIKAQVKQAKQGVEMKVPEVALQVKGGGTFGGGTKVVSKGYWFVNGKQLKQSLKQLKQQQKGTALIALSSLGLEVSCNKGVSEGATIEGNGEKEGQGKGRLALSGCTVIKPTKECTVAEPVTTAQIKTYLAANSTLQNPVIEVLEPTTGTTFMTLKLSAGCGIFAGSLPVAGNLAAEIVPKEQEAQELLVTMPTVPIGKIKHAGQEAKAGLTIIGEPTTFKAAYGTRLATNERFGAL